MSSSEINLHPSCRTVRQFAVFWLAFFGGLAVWEVAEEKQVIAFGLAALAFVGGIGGLVYPALLRPIYAGWMVLVFPLNWVVSHLLLAMLFFGVFTPLAVVLKLVGRDALQRRRGLDRITYWAHKPPASDVGSYYRPF
jgi:hypothetical protein